MILRGQGAPVSVPQNEVSVNISCLKVRAQLKYAK